MEKPMNTPAWNIKQKDRVFTEKTREAAYSIKNV